MEIRILVFLAFACVTVITNTVVIFFACKAFAGLTTKVATTVSDFERSETREWLQSMQAASAQAVTITQATKERIAEFEPVLAQAQENYNRLLAEFDAKLEKAADQINQNAQKVKDTVAKPAFSVMAFAAGVAKAMETIEDVE